ncbi:MAG: DUF1501 domain-containing protein, partial [Verrucomicrobiota bacterium]
MNRRDFLVSSSIGATALGTPLLQGAGNISVPKGKAEHCIFLWLGGGMAQIDTFDPKRKGDSKADPKKPGSEYDSIDTAVSGVKFCEHLPEVAKLADRLTVMRTIHHDAIDEHAF